jgi:hypothetical protein
MTYPLASPNVLLFFSLTKLHYRLGVARPFLMLEAFFLTLP